MTESSERPRTDAAAVSVNGAALVPSAPPYCGQCGTEITPHAPRIERFGEPFCSDAHAEAFVAGVRTARAQAASTRETAPAGTTTADQPAATPAGWNWKSFAKMAACCGLPVLALVVLGGGAALLGAAGAAAPLLTALACPLAMFFLMRGMTRPTPRDQGRGSGEEK
jgi:hypothetical protein